MKPAIVVICGIIFFTWVVFRRGSSSGIGESLLEIQNHKTQYVSDPTGNNSTCDITLPGNSVFGYLQPIDEVLEAELPEKTKCSVRVQGVTGSATEENLSLWHPPVDLSHLNKDQ